MKQQTMTCGSFVRAQIASRVNYHRLRGKIHRVENKAKVCSEERACHGSSQVVMGRHGLSACELNH